jgi:hypothetical protein
MSGTKPLISEVKISHSCTQFGYHSIMAYTVPSKYNVHSGWGKEASFIVGKGTSGTRWIAGWVDPTVSVEAEDSDQSPPLQAIEPRLPCHQTSNLITVLVERIPVLQFEKSSFGVKIVLSLRELHLYVLRNVCQFLLQVERLERGKI